MLFYCPKNLCFPKKTLIEVMTILGLAESPMSLQEHEFRGILTGKLYFPSCCSFCALAALGEGNKFIVIQLSIGLVQTCLFNQSALQTMCSRSRNIVYSELEFSLNVGWARIFWDCNVLRFCTKGFSEKGWMFLENLCDSSKCFYSLYFWDWFSWSPTGALPIHHISNP